MAPIVVFPSLENFTDGIVVLFHNSQMGRYLPCMRVFQSDCTIGMIFAQSSSAGSKPRTIRTNSYWAQLSAAIRWLEEREIGHSKALTEFNKLQLTWVHWMDRSRFQWRHRDTADSTPSRWAAESIAFNWAAKFSGQPCSFSSSCREDTSEPCCCLYRSSILAIFSAEVAAAIFFACSAIGLNITVFYPYLLSISIFIYVYTGVNLMLLAAVFFYPVVFLVVSGLIPAGWRFLLFFYTII